MKRTNNMGRSASGGKKAAQRMMYSCHPPAFTLIEIMFAITLFTFVVAAIYSSWTLILRATKVGREATAQVQRQRIAVRTIEDALMCAQSFQASAQYYTFIVQNGSEPLLSFAARLPDDFPRSGRLGGFNLRRVTFTVEAGPASEMDLVLRQNPVLMDMDQDEQNHPLVLARNVKGFTVECWDTNSMDWSEEWDYTNQIPPMVRFTLALGEKKGDNGTVGTGPALVVTRVVAFPSITVPTVVQMQSGGGGSGGGSGGGGGGPGSGFRPPSNPRPGGQR